MADNGRHVGVPGAWPAPSAPNQGWPPPGTGDGADAEPDDEPVHRADRSSALAAVGGGRASPAVARSLPPLRRVPLPPATVVRLPAPPLIRVTPVVARSIVGARGPIVDADVVLDAWAFRLGGRAVGTAPPDLDVDPDRDTDTDTAPNTGCEPVAADGDGDGDAIGRNVATAGKGSRWLGGERLPSDVWLLRDRVPPGSRTTIDHVLVASSGVWVVAVETGSRVELQHDRRRSAERRLLVGGKDRTDRATEIGLSAHQIRKIAARHDVPIHAAVCVVGGDRSLLTAAVRLHGVWISGPRRLLDMVRQPGALDAHDTEVVADMLTARLRER